MYSEYIIDSLVNFQLIKEEHKLLVEKLNNQNKIKGNN